MDRQRIDKWLWHARVVKARASASALVSGGRVRVNGARLTTPGHGVKIGDVLTISLDRRVLLWRIEAFAERRGDSHAARRLYTELDGGPNAPGADEGAARS